MKAGPVPTYEAMPPSTGPKSAPPIASPKTDPIIAPRRAVGAAATSQARPPVHENALENPCANRASSSCQSVSAKPTAVLVTAIEQSPISTVGLTPRRAATIPLGIAARSAPAG